MSSGKSGLWCDANLSCLRISTPQKPWSPTAELKTCWPPMMDSRSRHLPALGSTAPSTLDSHGHPLCPGARITLATHVGLSIPPSVYPESSVLLHSCCPSAEALYPPPSDFCFLRFFSLFGEERECVCVSFSSRQIQCVLQLFSPISSSYLPFSFHPPCALTVNVEPGSTDATMLVPSFLLANVFTMDWTWKHRNWLTHCLRIVSWSLLGFLFCQREQNTEPVGQMKDKTFLSSVVCFLYFMLNLTDILSVPRPLCSLFVCFMFLSVTLTGTPAFCF